MNLILLTILRSVIPGFLVFIGKNDLFWEKLNSIFESDYDFDNLQLITFVTGLVWASLVIPVQFALTSKRLRQREHHYAKLLEFSKRAILRSIEDSLKVKDFHFKVRMFVPVHHWLFRWRPARRLELIDVPGVSDEFHIRKLSFELEPEPEGLIGMAYAEKRIIIDLDVKGNDDYLVPQSLNPVLRNVRFCGAIPLFDDQRNVRAMIGIDSERSLDGLSIRERQELIDNLGILITLVDKYCNI